MTPEQLAAAEKELQPRVAKLAASGFDLAPLNAARTQALLLLLLGPDREHEAKVAMYEETERVISEVERMHRGLLIATPGPTPPRG